MPEQIQTHERTGSTMPDHTQVTVNGIDVDEGLAELLQALWAADIGTQYSCQGGPGEAMILFPTVKDALRFVTETFAVTGYCGCYTGRLPLELAAPDPRLTTRCVRAVVRWPHHMTRIWTAAWRGKPLPLDVALDVIDQLKAPDA